mgnify:CR=1 FL=1
MANNLDLQQDDIALADRMNEGRKAILDELHKRIIGQEQAIKALSQAIRRTRAGLKDPKRPGGSFIFAGPSGVGKTELSRTLASFLFGDEDALIQLDMSEYSERHTASRLFGAPPGYVGYDDSNLGGGLLISDIEKNPNCVILFDEIEKAHPDVMNILLAFMDNGFVTGSNGKEVNAKNCIVIMTSNLGSADSEKSMIGFGSQERTGEDDKALKEFFKPEFRNRIDLICKFGKLDILAIKKIVIKFTDDLKKSLKEVHDITLNFSEPVVEYLAEKGYDKKMGARPLSRKIDELIRVPLSKKILFERIKHATINVHVGSNDEIVFDVQQKLLASVGENGIIEVTTETN